MRALTLEAGTLHLLNITLGGVSLKNVPLHVQGGTANASFGEGIDRLLGRSFLGNFQVRLNNGLLELSPIE